MDKARETNESTLKEKRAKKAAEKRNRANQTNDSPGQIVAQS